MIIPRYLPTFMITKASILNDGLVRVALREGIEYGLVILFA